ESSASADGIMGAESRGMKSIAAESGMAASTVAGSTAAAPSPGKAIVHVSPSAAERTVATNIQSVWRFAGSTERRQALTNKFYDRSGKNRAQRVTTTVAGTAKASGNRRETTDSARSASAR